MQKTLICKTRAPNTNTEGDGKTLVFLANSGKEMTNGFTVDLSTIQAPVDNQDTPLKLVADLTDTDKLTLPLLTDHMPSIESQAGTVTKLWIDERGLMAEARLADTEAGRTVQQLAHDGALTNSFSITIDFAEEPGKDGIIHNAELVEISVVYRGADPRANLIQSFNRKDTENMTEDKKLENKLTKDEATELIDQLTKIVADLTDKNDDEDKPEEPDATDTPATSTQANTREGRTNIIINSAGSAGSIAKCNDPLKDWLKTGDALNAYERAIFNADNQGHGAFAKNWQAELQRHAYASGDSSIDETSVGKLIPTAVITEIEDVLDKASDLWPLYRKLDVDSFTVGAQVAGLTDNTRAHGYKVSDYGSDKKVQKFSLVSRQLAADYTQKSVVLNKGDIRRTNKPGALVRYVLSEMPNYILHTIDRQIVLGGYTDMNMFRSLTTDAADSSSEWAGNQFALTAKEGDRANLPLDLVGLAAKVTATGTKVLIMSTETKLDLITAADAIGQRLVSYGNDALAAYLGVDKLITPDWWTAADDAKTRAVVLVPEAYGIVGDTSIEAFTQFELRTNEQRYLSELFAGGALTKIKSAGILTPKNSK